eukprot:3952119-Ditylum_brightwellii.AAC.1
MSVTIPRSVTEIGEGAFYECSSLNFITIPDNAFEGCHLPMQMGNNGKSRTRVCISYRKEGILMGFSDEHPPKANRFILVTKEGILMEEKVPSTNVHLSTSLLYPITRLKDATFQCKGETIGRSGI